MTYSTGIVDAAAAAIAAVIREGTETIDVPAIVTRLKAEYPECSEQDITWHVEWEILMQADTINAVVPTAGR